MLNSVIHLQICPSFLNTWNTRCHYFFYEKLLYISELLCNIFWHLLFINFLFSKYLYIFTHNDHVWIFHSIFIRIKPQTFLLSGFMWTCYTVDIFFHLFLITSCFQTLVYHYTYLPCLKFPSHISQELRIGGPLNLVSTFKLASYKSVLCFHIHYSSISCF